MSVLDADDAGADPVTQDLLQRRRHRRARLAPADYEDGGKAIQVGRVPKDDEPVAVQRQGAAHRGPRIRGLQRRLQASRGGPAKPGGVAVLEERLREWPHPRGRLPTADRRHSTGPPVRAPS